MNSLQHDRQNVRSFSLSLIFVLSVASVIFFTTLGDCQLWDRDEPRNAGCAAEMMQRQDWVVPIFNDELRYQKPVFLYWLIISAYQMFGVNEWAARFWSAALGVGTVGLTYAMAWHVYGKRVATLSGIVLASSVMFVLASRAATPDSPLIFFSTLAIASFVFGAFSRSAQPALEPALEPTAQAAITVKTEFRDIDLRWRLMMGASMGGAVLTKGPIGFLMPMAVIGMFLLLMRQPKNAVDRPKTISRLRKIGRLVFEIFRPFSPMHFFKTAFSMTPFRLLAICLLVALPWYVWVGIKTEGDFLRIFFVKEHLGRSTTVLENHSGGPWFYPLAILVGFFPWSLFWLPVLVMLSNCMRAARAENTWFRFTDPTMVMMITWACVQVGVFTIAQTKLPSYVTPCYPALAIVTARCLMHWCDADDRIANALGATKLMVAAFWTALVTGVGLTIGFGVAGARFLNDVHLLWVGVPVASAATCALALHFCGDRAAAKSKRRQSMSWPKSRSMQLAAHATGASIFCLALFSHAAVRVANHQNNLQILAPISQLPEATTIASYGCLESSWVFYAGRPIFELATIGENAAPAVAERKAWEPKPRFPVKQFIELNPMSAIITTDRHLEALKAQLPESWQVVEEADYFLKRQRLFLLMPTKHKKTS